MDERVLDALARDRTIDITTIGAKSGRSQRIEIWAWVARAPLVEVEIPR